MTQRRVENTRVHFGANSPVSVKFLLKVRTGQYKINFAGLKVEAYRFLCQTSRIITKLQQIFWSANSSDIFGESSAKRAVLNLIRSYQILETGPGFVT